MSDVVITAELSANEAANLRRFGCTVADSVVQLYERSATARSRGETVLVVVYDVGAVEVERVAQLSGALIDAGADRLQYRDVDDVASLRAALAVARIGDARIDMY